jgi:polyisoprenoid-binding protein YceI
MKKKLVIIGVLLLITAMVGFLVIKMMYKKAERNVATENAIEVNVKDFVTLFKNFEDSANKLYLNKTIKLTGIISSKSETPDNKTNFIISVNDSLPSIDCTVDALYKSINVPDTITIKAICTGILTNINLSNSILIDSRKYTGEIVPLEKEKTSINTIDTTKTKMPKPEDIITILVFKTNKAQITFDAGGGLEDIKATNNQVEATIDISGNITFKLAMLQFKFADLLMQQHFNEEYVESSKYPTASFIGKIENMDAVKLNTDGSYKATIKGKLTLHGVTKPIETTAQLDVKNQNIKAVSSFKIILANFAVKSAAADEAIIKITANF